RQAYVAALVDPDERPAAAAYTNTARYVVRAAGAALAGVADRTALGLPLVICGAVQVVADLALFAWFRRVPLPADADEGPRPADGGEQLLPGVLRRASGARRRRRIGARPSRPPGVRPARTTRAWPTRRPRRPPPSAPG